MTLRHARCAFAVALAALVTYAVSLGYEIAFAEGMDRVTAKDPTTDHRKGSLHEIGLAQDMDLYLNGVYLTQTEDHAALGMWWEAYGVAHGLPLAWGGNFPPIVVNGNTINQADGNHYSLRWGGKA